MEIQNRIRRIAAILLSLVVSVAFVACDNDEDDALTTGGQEVTCVRFDDCVAAFGATQCNEDGVCADDSGDPVRVPACADGDSRPANDGCNTCSCESGHWACTEMACAPATCEDCLASGGTWQPEADACTSDCDLQDISCFRDDCPEPCGSGNCGGCFDATACNDAGCTWNQQGEAMWCTDSAD